MKLVLMGTPDFAVPMFERLANAHEILAVFTRGPKPVGRKHVLTKSPVHVWAESKNIPVYNRISEYNFTPDMVVVVAYGVILRDNVLQSAPCINIHPSLLPKYRGPSPIKTALINGDDKSGVCLMKMNQELDAGDILLCRNFNISLDDTNESIEKLVSKIGGDILIEYLDNPQSYSGIKQSGDIVFTKKYTGDDEIIDWKKMPTQIHNQIRALGCGRTKINGIDVKILKTEIKNGNLEIAYIQPAGKKTMDWKSFVNGLHGAKIEFGK